MSKTVGVGSKVPIDAKEGLGLSVLVGRSVGEGSAEGEAAGGWVLLSFI
jgi:hypothetical protein